MTADEKDPPKDPAADPFRLEPEEVRARPLPPVVEDTAETVAKEQAPPTEAKVVGKDGEERVISTRTLRERKDPDARTRPGPLPLPPGWPQEALSYPVRRPAAFAAVVAAWVAADAAGAVNVLLGWVAAVAATVLAARWQVRAVARTATGDDVAPAPTAAPSEDADAPAPRALGRTEFNIDRWRRVGWFLLYLAPAAVPILAPYLRSPSNPVRSGGEVAFLCVVLGFALLVMAPSFVLAVAFDDRDLEKPWHAARWFLRGPLAFVAFGVGWAVVLGGSALVFARWGSFLGTVALAVPARAAGAYALLLAARLLGVLGRRYEP
jgi:hypothetical protein